MRAAERPGQCRSPHLAREQSKCALLLIDVINDLSFEGAKALAPRARRMAMALEGLKARAERAGIPSVYVNDNFGRWRSDLQSLVSHCLEVDNAGSELTRRLQPQEADYFILKPLNSGFFSTALETLLRHLGADTLLLTGLTTDNCVLFTAHDAYLRGFRLFVPRDCTTAIDPERHRNALDLISRNLKADTRPSSRIALRSLAGDPKEGGSPRSG